MKSRSDLYYAAAKLIEEKGLAHGVAVRESGQCCTWGAVSSVRAGDMLGTYPTVYSEQLASDLGFKDRNALFAWNDRATKTTVVRRLLRAAVKVMG